MGRPTYRRSSAQDSEDGAPPSAQELKLNKKRAAKEEHCKRLGKNYGTKRIPTVSVTRKAERRRASQRFSNSNNETKLGLRLAAVRGVQIPEEERMKLITNDTLTFVQGIKERSRRRCQDRSIMYVHMQPLLLIGQLVTSLIHHEKNNQMLSWLMRVAAWMMRCCDEAPIDNEQLTALFTYAVNMLREEQHDIALRCAGLRLLVEIINATSMTHMCKAYALTESMARKLAVIGAHIIIRYRAAGRELVAGSRKEAWHYERVHDWRAAEVHLAIELINDVLLDVTDDCISALLSSHEVVATVTVAVPSEYATDLFRELLRRCCVQDLAYWTRNFPDELEAAFMVLDCDAFYSLISSNRPPLTAFIAKSDNVVERILQMIRMNPQFDHYWGHIGAFLLQYAVQQQDGGRELDRLLGTGLLSAARITASERDQSDEIAASCRTFRRLLRVRPQYRRLFKEYTKEGHANNPIYVLGQSIVARPKVEPTLYVLDTTEEQVEPSQTTVPSFHSSSVPKQENAAPQEEKAEEGGDIATFTDLPQHFVVELTRSMTFAEMINFRLTCKKALAAVDDRGNSMRKLCITQLVRDMWPEKFRQDKPIDTLYCMQKEMIRISQWMNFDLVSLIDFEGVRTLNSAQLESIFGIEPYRNVVKINLVGIVVLPSVWHALSLLFPQVKVVRCTESTSQFPEGIMSAVVNMAGDTICGTDIIDRRGHQMRGVLGDERMTSLRCIKTFFPSLSCIFID